MMYSLGEDNILCIYELKDKEFELKKERLNIGISFGEIYLYNENKLIKVSSFQADLPTIQLNYLFLNFLFELK